MTSSVTFFESASGAVISWLPDVTVIPTPPLELSSVNALAPPIVYLFVLLKLIWPVVWALSTVTVRGWRITEPKFATAPIALGAVFGVQFVACDQLPSASTFHVALVGPM